MNTPHKHAELIKAWADGALIQGKYNGVWVDCTRTPVWNLDEYRVKPEVTTSLSDDMLYNIYCSAYYAAPDDQMYRRIHAGLRAASNAAIKQYIKENTK